MNVIIFFIILKVTKPNKMSSNLPFNYFKQSFIEN